MDKNNQAWVWSRYRGIINEQQSHDSRYVVHHIGRDVSSIKLPAILLGSIIIGMIYPFIATLLCFLLIALMAWNIAELRCREFLGALPFNAQIFNALEGINEFLGI